MAAKPPAVLLMAGEPIVDVAADIRETRLWGIARRNRLETVEFMMNERNKRWVLLACGAKHQTTFLQFHAMQNFPVC